MRGRFIERQTTPRLPQQRLSSLRRALLAVGALGGVAGGLALGPIGCGTAEPVAPYTGPTTDPTQLYMRLAFDQPAVTLSTEPGYNTLQLTVRPLDALGQPMTGLPAPTFTSSDTSRVLVTAGGLVTALKTGSAVKVIAEMTAGLVRHADTAQIDVTALTAPPELASLTIHPAPPDSAIWLGPLLTSSGAPTAVTSAVGIATPTIVPRVLDTFGNPIAGLRIEYSTLEVGIVTVPRWSNASSVAPTIVRPGLVHVVARTTAYGITKADTVAYTVTYPYIGDFQARLGTNGLPGFYFATPRAATVGPELKDIHVVAGAILLWSNFLTDSVHDTVDVTFDDPMVEFLDRQRARYGRCDVRRSYAHSHARHCATGPRLQLLPVLARRLRRWQYRHSSGENHQQSRCAPHLPSPAVSGARDLPVPQRPYRNLGKHRGACQNRFPQLKDESASHMAMIFLSLLVVAVNVQAQNVPASRTAPGIPPTTAVSPLAFRGVTVIDVQNGARLPDQTVVIVGHSIQAMGPTSSLSLPEGTRLVDARGKYLIPGLWDMHVHPLHYAIDVFYPLLLANGVTGIRDAGSRIPLDTLRRWRREILAGTRVGPPRQLLSGPSIAGPQEGCERSALDDVRRPGTCVADTADARHLVDSLQAAGADMIKPREVTAAVYRAIAAEARRLGIPFGGHLWGDRERPAVSAIEASDSGASIVDHFGDDGGIDTLCIGSRADAERCGMVAERFRRNNTWWVPTLIQSVDAPDEKYRAPLGPVTRAMADRFIRTSQSFFVTDSLLADPPAAFRRSLQAGNVPPAADSTVTTSGVLSLARRVGLPILAGTDVNPITRVGKAPGFSLHAELAIYVAEGLTPLEALQTATLDPAKFLHATDSFGTVAPGKLADLVLLDADPLADIANTMAIRAVVANGQYYDRAALDVLVHDARSAVVETLPSFDEQP